MAGRVARDLVRPVIPLHRLMKNSVQASEYIFMSDAAVRFAELDDSRLQSHVEQVEGVGSHRLWLACAMVRHCQTTGFRVCGGRCGADCLLANVRERSAGGQELASSILSSSRSIAMI